MSKRRELLERATSLFASHGFEGTSLQSIADAISVTKAAVLHHFPSKEALRTAVIDEVLGHFREVLPEVLVRTAERGDLLDALFVEVERFFEERPDAARLLVREALDRPDALRAILTEHVRPWIAMAAASLHAERKKGRVAEELDPEAYLVTYLLALLSRVALGEVAEAMVGSAGGKRLSNEIRRNARTGLLRPGASARREKK